ncbi:MAG: hypothetical protein ACREHC_00110 [Candidatus Levyibacteriota bacterium]
MTKNQLLEHAIDVAKEYARGGGSNTPDYILEIVYKKLKELNEDVKSE